jgi:hypothetical protein
LPACLRGRVCVLAQARACLRARARARSCLRVSHRVRSACARLHLSVREFDIHSCVRALVRACASCGRA